MAVQLLPPFTAGLDGDTQQAENNYIRQAFKLLPDGVVDLLLMFFYLLEGPPRSWPVTGFVLWFVVCLGLNSSSGQV